MCGHKFEVGDVWRWLYSKTTINPLICEKCDGPDVLERWVAHVKRGLEVYWWLSRD
jgi:hypothetical protein